MQKVSSQAQVNLQKIRVLRKGVAKILTILTEKRRDAARATFKGAKYTPRDLRARGTRAHRRRLTPFERRRLTTAQQKRADNFRQRKYAIA